MLLDLVVVFAVLFGDVPQHALPAVDALPCEVLGRHHQVSGGAHCFFDGGGDGLSAGGVDANDSLWRARAQRGGDGRSSSMQSEKRQSRGYEASLCGACAMG